MGKRMAAALARLLVVASLLGGADSDRAAAAVPSPTVQGPVAGGRGVPVVAATGFDLGVVGYVQEEFFLSGTATAYASAGPLGSDGRWTATPAAAAPYATRVLVYRPADARRFNGTVLVEWLNVSSGFEAAPDWIAAHTELIREGWAWMGVSAQQIGVEGGSSLLGIPALGLKGADPARYGALSHPGDSFSYDVFSQAGQALRPPSGAGLLGGFRVKRVIAAGESQSAFRMVTYVNAVHPLAGVYDGFLIHSRGASGAPLSQAPQPAIAAPRPAFIRDDLRVPVLTFQTETDLLSLGFLTDRQPDTRRIRLWEVAGTAHADVYTVLIGSTDLGDSPAAAALVVTAAPIPGFIECASPINAGPQHFVLKAALAALHRWVRTGRPPRPAPRLAVDPGPPATLVRDEHGNALGGVRTPQLDVPIATLSGFGQTGSLICFLLGTTLPFDPATLAGLYPDHDAYVRAFKRATRRAVRAGAVLPPDAKLMKAAAAASSIGR